MGIVYLLNDLLSVSLWYLVPRLIFGIAFNLLFAFAVYYDASSRNIVSKKMWGILTFFCSWIAAIIYLFFSNTNGERNKSEKRKSVLLFILSLIVIVCNVCYCEFVLFPANEKAANSFSGGTSLVYYTDENGNEVIYDKMGNTYTYEQWIEDGIRYYDRQGKVYKCTTDSIVCIDTNESTETLFGDKEFFIDEQGYVVEFESDEQCETWNIYCDPNNDMGLDSLYYSKDGRLLYNLSDCQWDENGNLVFDAAYTYKDFRYEDIPEDEMLWNIE